LKRGASHGHIRRMDKRKIGGQGIHLICGGYPRMESPLEFPIQPNNGRARTIFFEENRKMDYTRRHGLAGDYDG